MGEVLDIVDIYGEPTGLQLDKQIVHAEGLRHKDVHIFITNGHEVVQQQRCSNKNIMPDLWDASGSGHPMAGESFLDAAMRELQEELGLQFARERFIRLGFVPTAMHFPGWRHPHRVVNDNFVVYEPNISLADIRIQPEEVQAVRLYDIDRLERDLLDPATPHEHAFHPFAQYSLAIAGMRAIAATA